MAETDAGRRRGAGDWPLAAEAALWLAAAGVALRVLTFARLAALASRRRPRRPGESRDPNRRRAPEREAARIAWAIRAAADRAPWPALCFERALAAHVMLGRRGLEPTLYYGARGGGALDAHVWVRLGDADVVGGEEAGAYAVLATFPPAARP